MSTITINGVVVAEEGRHALGLVDGRIVVDGRDVTPPASVRTIQIEVHGDLDQLEVDSCATVSIMGRVGNVSANRGNVHCDDVAGSVQVKDGHVHCGNVGGDVLTVSSEKSN